AGSSGTFPRRRGKGKAWGRERRGRGLAGERSLLDLVVLGADPDVDRGAGGGAAAEGGGLAFRQAGLEHHLDEAVLGRVHVDDVVVELRAGGLAGEGGQGGGEGADGGAVQFERGLFHGLDAGGEGGVGEGGHDQQSRGQ